MKSHFAAAVILVAFSTKVVAGECYKNSHKVLDARTNIFVVVTDSLEVKSRTKDAIEFSLVTLGPNFHQCQVEGKAVKKEAYFEYVDSLPGEVCRLRISFADSQAHVLDPDYYPCHKYCGARGNIHLRNDGKTFQRASGDSCES